MRCSLVEPLVRPVRNGKRPSLATFEGEKPLPDMSALPMFQRFSTGMAGTSSSMLPEPKRRFERWPLPSRTEPLRSLRQHIEAGEQIERKLKSRHLTTIPPLRKRYLWTQHGQ
uniref:Uncharacterized protein n=1 Tax=Anopheles melas TaxID=34690 RepID=A0A182TWG4_9DIPT